MSAQNARVPADATRPDATRPDATRPDATRRWRWLAAALGGFLTLAVLYGAYWAQVLRHHQRDRKSTRLNSSHSQISYAVFCLKKKKISRSDVINRLAQGDDV